MVGLIANSLFTQQAELSNFLSLHRLGGVGSQGDAEETEDPILLEIKSSGK